MRSCPTFTTKKHITPPMSEFSESYHLRTENIEDACSLLRQAGIKGFVFPATNGWVTFVAEDGRFEPDQRIVAAARQSLLHYVNAEDHGWSFALYDGGQLVSAYRCDWDGNVSYDDTAYSRSAIEKIVPSVDPEALTEFEAELHPSDSGDVFGAEPARLFAEAVGLERYEWLSYHYVKEDIEHSEDEFEGLIRVS